MQALKLRLLSALEKVFPDEAPRAEALTAVSGFQGETVSFQAAVFLRADAAARASAEVDAGPCAVRVRRVEMVPVRGTAFTPDGNYLRTAPGLYPDPLADADPADLKLRPRQWDCLWIDLTVAGGAAEIPVRVRFRGEKGDLLAEETLRLTALPGELPPQRLVHTKWIHTDCLAEYYRVPVFSEEWWRITENYIRAAVSRGINMIYTPVHTPPLDTRIGGERPTVQLTDITVTGGVYAFGFEKLDRWVEMCRRCGAEYFEIAHLFTQWGAHAAPKIMARVDGETKRIFGWDTPATGEAYREFLGAYLPALRERLEALGIADRCAFHISDEPHGEENLVSYRAAKEAAAPYLEGCTVMDALSDFAYWREGVVRHPIPSCDHLRPFLEAGIDGLWTYYCCGQGFDVTNTFIAMPSPRTRIVAAQLWKSRIAGLLQWAYNFWFSQGSTRLINPWLETDNDCFGPAGDGYQVYPGADGTPVESVRCMVFFHAMQDLRAYEWLEELGGRECVESLMREELGDLDWENYPADAACQLRLRERVNREIARLRG